MRVLWGIEVAAAALLWATLVIGLSVSALTVPVYTSAMTQALGVPGTAALSASDVVKLSGGVRAFVADADSGVLPATWRGAPAFDEAAVSHLRDVRAVLSGARIATGAAALLLAFYVGFGVMRRRFAQLSEGMAWGAVLIAVFLLLAGGAALLDFETVFASFHGLFFAAGTWTFPYDSMLIRLFPERFWAASAAAWAGLSLLGGIVLVVTARLLRVTSRRDTASRSTNSV
jgi:integral membrane protein (TIGR01906 family)